MFLKFLTGGFPGSGVLFALSMSTRLPLISVGHFRNIPNDLAEVTQLDETESNNTQHSIPSLLTTPEDK